MVDVGVEDEGEARDKMARDSVLGWIGEKRGVSRWVVR